MKSFSLYLILSLAIGMSSIQIFSTDQKSAENSDNTKSSAGDTLNPVERKLIEQYIIKTKSQTNTNRSNKSDTVKLFDDISGRVYKDNETIVLQTTFKNLKRSLVEPEPGLKGEINDLYTKAAYNRTPGLIGAHTKCSLFIINSCIQCTTRIKLELFEKIRSEVEKQKETKNK